MELFVRPRTQFDSSRFPRFTTIYYNYWAYKKNQRGVIVGKSHKEVEGRTWLRIKFDHLKTPRAVPITSVKGCHISTAPLAEDDCEYLYTPYEA